MHLTASLSLLTLALLYHLHLTSACLSFYAYDYWSGIADITLVDDGTHVCKSYQVMNGDPNWFWWCKPGVKAYWSKDRKSVHYERPSGSFDMQVTGHVRAIRGVDMYYANEFNCDCWGWMCQGPPGPGKKRSIDDGEVSPLNNTIPFNMTDSHNFTLTDDINDQSTPPMWDFEDVEEDKKVGLEFKA